MVRIYFRRLGYFWDTARSLLSLLYAFVRRFPGIRFDCYGRFLAARAIIKISAGKYLPMFLNPVSCVRYFEFDFVDQSLRKIPYAKVLDVSSPRIMPFWLAEKRGFSITMINPDKDDLFASQELSTLVKNRFNIVFKEGSDAARLDFAENSFDIVTSISVIEHVKSDADAIKDFIRVVRPGGQILLTFPVLGQYFEEYRDYPVYATRKNIQKEKSYFFQRFYDEEAINSRLLSDSRLRVIAKQYFVESVPGWFQGYVKEWQERGLKLTLDDPRLMAKFFRGPQIEHPKDRMGNCNLFLEVVK